MRQFHERHPRRASGHKIFNESKRDKNQHCIIGISKYPRRFVSGMRVSVTHQFDLILHRRAIGILIAFK